MKNLLKNFAFYVVLLFVTSLSVQANDILKEDAVNQMENFLFASKKSIVTGKSWNTFKSVVKTYNEDKTAFQQLNEKQIEDFNVAVKELNKKLSGLKSADASKWISTLNETAEIVNRRWNFDFNSILPKDDEIVSTNVPTWFNINSILPSDTETYDQIISEKSTVPAWFNLSSLLPTEDDKEVQLGDELSTVPTWLNIHSLLPQNESTDERIVE